MNLYSTCTPLDVDCFVYEDSLRLSPAPDGVYYDGLTCWIVSGGLGKITSQTACITTTTTIAPPPESWCYDDNGTTIGPFPDLASCEAAGGFGNCFQCII